MASRKALVRNEFENGGRSLSAIVAHHVPRPAYGMDQDPVESAVDRLSQAADMHVNEVCLRVELQIPHSLEQHGARDHLARAPHEKLEERKFLRRKLDLAAGATRAPAKQIQLQICDLQGSRGLRTRLAAQERLYAREQLDEREGFREIVITARAQAAHPII